MSKLVPNKKTYVKRLKAMLKRKEPCERCPCQPHFGCKKILVSGEQCRWCRDFIDMPQVFIGCPCSFYGKEAPNHAYYAIEAYEAGEHKWCKGGS